MPGPHRDNLAFSAESSGAAEVTGLDAATAQEFRHVPFAQSWPYRDIAGWREDWTRRNLIPIKKSWWYGWHKTKSNARCVYAPISELYEWDHTFDVVIAGALVEHLSDPVYAIGAWAKVAREAVILPWADVVVDDTLLMRPVSSWTDPKASTLMWWQLSAGLYSQLFDNLGFDSTFEIAKAVYNDGPEAPQAVQRPTIIARRRCDKVNAALPANTLRSAHMSLEIAKLVQEIANLRSQLANQPNEELARAAAQKEKLARAAERISLLTEETTSLRNNLEAMQESTSWRLTAPMRSIVGRLRRT